MSSAVSARVTNETLTAEAPGVRNQKPGEYEATRAAVIAGMNDKNSPMAQTIQTEMNLRQMQMKIEQEAMAATQNLTGIMEHLSEQVGWLTAAVIGASALGMFKGGGPGAPGGGGGRFGNLAGKLAGGAGVLGAVYSAGSTYASTGSVGAAASATAGSVAGGLAGGALGSFLGPVGTFVGSTAGSMAGGWAGQKLHGMFSGGSGAATGGSGGDMKQIAEAYLGRQMTPDEYNYLVRATYAEAGPKSDQELALIMGSILNRARDSNSSIISVLTARNQFQSVTGTANNPGPSSNFKNGPSAERLKKMEGAVSQYLMKVSHSQKNFTAADSAAYGAGTNIGYRNTMLAQGGQTVGGSVFNAGFSGSVATANTSSGSGSPAPVTASSGLWGQSNTAKSQSSSTPSPPTQTASVDTSATAAAAPPPSSTPAADASTKLLVDLNNKMAMLVDLTTKSLRAQQGIQSAVRAG
jgi:hypothetical protein